MPYEYIELANTGILSDCEQTIVIDGTKPYRLEDYKHLIIRNFDQYLKSRSSDLENKIKSSYYKGTHIEQIYPTIDKIIKDVYNLPYFPSISEVKIASRFCNTIVKIIFDNEINPKHNCIAYTF